MSEEEEWDDYGQIKQALADQGFSQKLVDNFPDDCEACTQTYRGIVMTTMSDIADFSGVAFSGFDISGEENFYKMVYDYAIEYGFPRLDITCPDDFEDDEIRRDFTFWLLMEKAAARIIGPQEMQDIGEDAEEISDKYANCQQIRVEGATEPHDKCNGIYALLPDEVNGRPCFRNDKKIVWYCGQLGRWAISPGPLSNLVKVKKPGCFMVAKEDKSLHPCEARSPWSGRVKGKFEPAERTLIVAMMGKADPNKVKKKRRVVQKVPGKTLDECVGESCAMLGIACPDDGLSALKAISNKLFSTIQEVPDGEKYLTKPILNPEKFDEKRMEILKLINSDLSRDYTLRKEMLMKRFEVIAESILASEKIAKQNNTVEVKKIINSHQRLIQDTSTSIPAWMSMCAQKELFRIDKIVSAASETGQAIRKVKIGKVPDRGGRPGEVSKQKISAIPFSQYRKKGGGRRGGWRGGRGGARRGGYQRGRKRW